MRVRVMRNAEDVGPRRESAVFTVERAPRCWGGWRPELTLGADSVGGLMLPDAHPSAHTLYAPRGVWIDEQRVIVADTGNHRVLIWNSWPLLSGAPADVILGQPDEVSEGPNAGSTSVRLGLHLPTGVLIDDGRLIVADAWNHRVLVWDSVPVESNVSADHVIGQQDLSGCQPNRGGGPDAGSLYWPFGIAIVDGRFYVTDTGNRRVLGWRAGVPLAGEPADVILGQPDPFSREENRGAQADADSFRWPHAVCSTGAGGVYVADAGNHRLLRWDEHPDSDVPANAVIGQPSFELSAEFPYQSQEGHLRFPYAAVSSLVEDADGVERCELAVADTANNRVLIWERGPRGGEPVDFTLGQRDHAGAGENRWESVQADTFCWPYGLSRCADRLAVADSGNNRVTIWRRSEEN